MEERIETGVYRHHKGGRYLVLGSAIESTNARAGITVVVYVSLTTGRVHVRAMAEFKEILPGGIARFERQQVQP